MAVGLVVATSVGLVACGGDGAARRGSDGVTRRAAEAPAEPTPTSRTVDPSPVTTATSAVAPSTIPPTTVAAAPTPTTAAPAAPGPPRQAPVGVATAPVEVERCASSVSVGGMVVGSRGGCLTRTGLVWQTSGPVVLAGLIGDPVGGARLVVDPLNARVAGSGYSWSLRGGDGAEALELSFGSSPIDWSFQYPRALGGTSDGGVDPSQVAARTATVARLPGLADVRSLPDVRPGIRDYAALGDPALAEYVAAFPAVNSSAPVFSFAAIGLTAFPALEVELPTTAVSNLLGLPVETKVALTPQARNGVGGVVLDTTLRLPDVLRGYRGSSRVFVGADGTFQVDRAEVSIPVVEVGAVRLKPVTLRYDLATDEWYGRVGAFVGVTGNAPGLSAELRIRDGALQRIGVVVAGLPVPLGPGVSLTALGGTLDLEPFAIAADASVTFGPKVLGTPGALSVVGSAAIGGTETAVSGTFAVASLEVGQVAVGYRYGERVTLSGKIGLTFGEDAAVGVAGTLDGWATTDAFQMDGAVDVSLWDVGRIRGEASMSEGGVAACADLKIAWFERWRFGVGYPWGGTRADLLGATCNSKTYLLDVRTRNAAPTTVRPAGVTGPVLVAARTESAGATTGPATVTVPEGEKVLAVLLEAPGGVGRVRLTAPDGSASVTTAIGSPTSGAKVVAVRRPDGQQVTVLVADPAPGRWVVEPLDGGPVAVVVEATATGFTAVAPTTPVPAAEVTTRADGRIVTPAVRAEPDGEASPPTRTDPTLVEPGARTERAAPAPDGRDGAGGSAAWIWVGLLVVVVGTGGGVATSVVRRRRRRDA